jgi:hypothetical protein
MRDKQSGEAGNLWPSLPFAEWRETLGTLHMWTQIVGKVRLAQAPPVNHWWQVPLYVNARGLTTSAMPYGERTFQIDFDFLDHKLLIRTGEGDGRDVALAPRTVADFYREFMSQMHALKLDVKIWTTPVEVEKPIPFEQDEVHGSYDPEYAGRFRRVLVQAERLFQQFRSGFVGKCSPVHFFWGSFDLAVTRFSGRRAPKHPGTPGVPDSITSEAYSHEVSSAGLWPGGEALPEAIFYSYAYPEPEGFKDFHVGPEGVAYYNTDFKEFVLPYEAVRVEDDPDRPVLQFLQDTYEAAATHAEWDRAALERNAG